MGEAADNIWLAGVDGCPSGWIVVFARPDGQLEPARFVKSFAEVAKGSEHPTVIAIDVPIGLPDRSPRKGRLAEGAVRPLLGARKSSVFRIPSREAVYASVASDPADERARFLHACNIARNTSEDGKAFAKQGFYILDKVVELDQFLRVHPHYITSVYETHPELAFWRLNGGRELSTAKKVKGRSHEPGMAMRRGLLLEAGFPREHVFASPPEPAGFDDLLDALACAAIAQRINKNEAQPFPKAFERDAYGLPMAIWA